MRVTVGEAAEARLGWRTAGGVRAGAAFDLASGERSYLVPVASLPAWVWPERIEDLDLEIAGAPAAVAAVEVSLRLPGELAR